MSAVKQKEENCLKDVPVQQAHRRGAHFSRTIQDKEWLCEVPEDFWHGI